MQNPSRVYKSRQSMSPGATGTEQRAILTKLRGGTPLCQVPDEGIYVMFMLMFNFTLGSAGSCPRSIRYVQIHIFRLSGHVFRALDWVATVLL